MQIFLDDRDYERFVQLLADVVEEFDLECWAFCVMPNHYHLTLRTIEPTVSVPMRVLNGNYAQWWNKRHDRVGHVFQGRFKEQIVQRQDYLLALCRYITLNPVRAGLVTRPEEWKWGSYRTIAGMTPTQPFVSATSVLQQFGDDNADVLRKRFANFVFEGPSDELVDSRIRSAEKILGDAAFKRSFHPNARSIADGLLIT